MPVASAICDMVTDRSPCSATSPARVSGFPSPPPPRPPSIVSFHSFPRRIALTAHITFAGGWLGGGAALLPLAIVGLTSQDAQLVRSVYLAMALIARWVIVPLSFAPLVTGPILSLGTPWGLFRHY